MDLFGFIPTLVNLLFGGPGSTDSSGGSGLGSLVPDPDAGPGSPGDVW